MGKQVQKLKTEEFSRGVRNARGRLDHLRKKAAEIFSNHPLMMETFEELQSTVEKLETAEEELFQQFEELVIARNELDNERIRYQGLFDFAPDAYIVTNKEGAIIEANRAASRLLEISLRFITRKLLASYIDEQDRKYFRSEMSRLTRATSVQEIELRLKPRLRESFDASLRVGPVRNNEGKVVALRWMIRDVTERKLTEERIRKANEELEQRVRERTSEIEAANRAKDEFLAVVSHELRTPLNAVTGWVEILRARSNDPSMVRHAIEVIERNARAQAQIIEDILEFSRQMAATTRLELKPVDLRSIIEKSIEAASPAAQAAGLQLCATIDESVDPVLGDADRLAQVVGNLLANSIKFTLPEGRIEVKLAKEGERAQIIVSDTGKGISAGFLPHVFDSFSQADSSSRRIYGGLGLGLAIARRFIEMHGGTISAESPGEGRGATIIISLPFMKEVQGTLDDVAEAGAAEPGPIETLSRQVEGVWVLAVDDQADTLDMLRIVLEQLGAKVTTALSCAEALRVIDEETCCPDVLVADIAMPEENGYDLIRKIRRMDPHRGGTIPAIALTAYAGEEDRIRALAEGYQLHLAKPVSILELVPSIAKLVHRQDEHG